MRHTNYWSVSSTADRRSLDSIRHEMACTLIGQTVDVMAGARNIVHGVVTGVLNEYGIDKLVVGGMEYDLNQLLTVTPPSVH